jgi:peptidoglycan/xylan/chitin deacetylase (PgdA/CDA1 family)
MLKRLLVLVIALGLFIVAFLAYFHLSDARINHDFSVEREKFHVDGQELTTANPPVEVMPAPVSAPPAADVAPAPSTPSPESVPPSSDSSPTISPAPPASSTPDSVPATNASPSSTLVYPGLRQLPFVVMATYTSEGLRIQEPTGTVAVPAVPATDAPPIAPVTTGTNAIPPPVPVEAPAISESPAGRPTKNAPASVIVLGYHQFNPPGVRGVGPRYAYNMPQDVFDGEMKYLKDNNYHVVPLSDVVRFAKGEITLPPGSVAVTIDDGYKSAIVYAAPVLKKYGFPWTFFIYPAFIATHENKGAASWSDLKELQDEGIDIECHSMTHPFLSHHHQAWKGPMHPLTPEEYADFLTNETATAKAEIEQHLGKPVIFFAYPFGDHDKTVEARVISAGFQAIFTVAGNPIHPGTDVYSMGRYVITPPVEKAFTAYLREGALGLGDISPTPGSIVTDPRPIISAVLGYEGTINPASISTEVRDMGEVRNDFDPRTGTIRIYLPHDLIESAIVIDVRAKDARTGQTMVASWRFNYQPTAAGAAHAPIGAKATEIHHIGIPESTVHGGAPKLPLTGAAKVPLGSSNATPVETVPAKAVPDQPVPSTVPASNAAPTAP